MTFPNQHTVEEKSNKKQLHVQNSTPIDKTCRPEKNIINKQSFL